MRMNDIIKSIKERAYEGIDSEMIEVRLRLLYSAAVEAVSDSDMQTVTENIIEYEKSECLHTVRQLGIYASPEPADILSDNSKIAVYFALARKESGRTFPLAEYMLASFTDFVEKEKSALGSARYRRVISETMVDFLYASGSSDMMSFRVSSME